MKAKTRLFGEIDIAEDKIIKMEQGIIGFPNMKNFTLIYDLEKGEKDAIKWFQSMDEPEFAMPVMEPQLLVEDYNPSVSEEVWNTLGDITPENSLILATVTIPSEIEKISINLKAPIIINMDTKKANQIIVEDDYPVKYEIYDLLKKGTEKEGE